MYGHALTVLTPRCDNHPETRSLVVMPDGRHLCTACFKAVPLAEKAAC